MRRSFLFLQGPCTPFFRRLAQALRERGCRVRRVQFNAGDVLSWRLGGAAWFRGRLQELPGFYREQFRRWGTTDVVLFGDCRAVHEPAVARARELGLRVHVFEEGYFRPHRVTLEADGVNAHSLLNGMFERPQSRWGSLSGDEAPVATKFHSPFWQRAVYDVAYHVAGLLNPLLFPHYRTHARYAAPLEYLGYALRLPALRWHRPRDDEQLLRLLRERRRFFFFPLQLDGDSQVRRHAHFEDMSHAMRHVAASFARHAPAGAVLLIKNHPLDPGLARHRRQARRLARELGIAERVVYMETGQLPRILRQAAGVVTINSTVGIMALERSLPVMVLGKALYALPGLVFQGSLDDFWVQGAPPDMHRFQAFRQVVLAHATINGGFYDRTGMDLAVRGSVARLLGV